MASIDVFQPVAAADNTAASDTRFMDLVDQTNQPLPADIQLDRFLEVFTLVVGADGLQYVQRLLDRYGDEVYLADNA